MSTIKVGDKVRATCGESVIIGKVKVLLVANAMEVVPDGAFRANILDLKSWRVEVIAPPICETYGAVVVDKEGDAWQRRTDGWRCIDYPGSPGLPTDVLQHHYGPVIVVWPTP